MAPDGALIVQPGRVRAAAAVCGAALFCAAGLLVASWSESRYDWLEALARALAVGAPIGVGLYAHRRAPFARFGTLLIGVGALAFVATLASSPNELVHSLGRVAAWPADVAVVCVVLAFPSGRLEQRADRRLAAAIAVLVLVLYLPTALLVESYPVPSAWDACTHGCPA